MAVRMDEGETVAVRMGEGEAVAVRMGEGERRRATLRSRRAQWGAEPRRRQPRHNRGNGSSGERCTDVQRSERASECLPYDSGMTSFLSRMM